MATGRIQRRLAAIMAMDVAGYSRLMQTDEAGTLASLQAARKDVIDPCLAEFDGRLVKTTGDGLLVEFASAVAAVECAAAIQSAIARRATDGCEIRFRIGLNIGEIIVEGEDIHGDGVNIAARLEQIAAPGSVFVSETLHEHVNGRTSLRLDDVGPRMLKNISQAVRVYRVAQADPSSRPGTRADAGAPEQEVRFCRSADGTTIAYAAVGDGPPLVKAANWLTHLEYDWISPIWRPYYAWLAREHRLVRYDQRGNGLSDREVADLSLDAMVADLEAVVDAAGLDRFALLAWSQGGPISIAYASRHPERVTHLVLHGTYAQGWRARGNADEIKRREAMMAMMEGGWGSPSSAFHQMFSSVFVPDGSPDQIAWWTELQRNSTTPRQSVALQEAQSRYDVLPLLPTIKAPTLVTHSRNEAVQPFEAGRKVASLIPRARFVPLDSRNHIILEQEPAWPRFVAEVRDFLGHPGYREG
jgi:class 3 adenylate cyclase/pimeloyl-ACP methyl ester carboxylesterase